MNLKKPEFVPKMNLGNFSEKQKSIWIWIGISFAIMFFTIFIDAHGRTIGDSRPGPIAQGLVFLGAGIGLIQAFRFAIIHGGLIKFLESNPSNSGSRTIRKFHLPGSPLEIAAGWAEKNGFKKHPRSTSTQTLYVKSNAQMSSYPYFLMVAQEPDRYGIEAWIESPKGPIPLEGESAIPSSCKRAIKDINVLLGELRVQELDPSAPRQSPRIRRASLLFLILLIFAIGMAALDQRSRSNLISGNCAAPKPAAH